MGKLLRAILGMEPKSKPKKTLEDYCDSIDMRQYACLSVKGEDCLRDDTFVKEYQKMADKYEYDNLVHEMVIHDEMREEYLKETGNWW